MIRDNVKRNLQDYVGVSEDLDKVDEEDSWKSYVEGLSRGLGGP